MKAITVSVVALVVIIAGLSYMNKQDMKALDYVKETVEVQEAQPEETVQDDTIEKARQDLERINQELDAKEQELLNERDAINAELERLRETRVSFQ